MGKPKYKIIYTRLALTDLEEIFDYIAEDNFEVAQLYLQSLDDTIQYLSEFPLMGKISIDPELRRRKIRVLVFKRYLIFYKIEDHSIIIQRVVHASRDFIHLV